MAYYEIPYEGLVTEDASGNIVGVLATDWSYNDDNTELTFNLREGVVFHDGTPFNAESVKSNIEFIKNENGFPPTANQLGAVEEVVADDEYTATFKLSRPDVALLPNLARFIGLQVSPNAYDSFEAVPLEPAHTKWFQMKTHLIKYGFLKRLKSIGIHPLWHLNELKPTIFRHKMHAPTPC